MAVKEDCRHYLFRSTARGDGVQRCRLSVNEEHPFACPESCLFFEARPLMGAGWTAAPSAPMSNTADGLVGLPPETKRRRGKKRR
ncbi:MAG TPA: hypothetical protein VMO88_11990 [Acidimicrobiales bacterium]|nr:hypothetical protein [Acidimicrobiales bacterium]